MPQESLVKQEPAVSDEERRRFVRLRHEVRLTVRRIAGNGDDLAARPGHNAGGLLLVLGKEVPIGTRLLLHAKVEPEGIDVRLTGCVAWYDYCDVTETWDTGLCLIGASAVHREGLLAVLTRPPHEAVLRQVPYLVRLAKPLRLEYRQHKLLSRWKYARLREASAHGLQMVAEDRLPPGAALALRLHLEDGPDQLVEGEGEVVTCELCTEPRGMFQSIVRLDDLPDAARKRLGACVSRALTAEMDVGMRRLGE